MSRRDSAELTVGAAQLEPVLGDIERNVDKHLEVIERARTAGVELLVFPELSLTGYDMGERAPELGIALGDPLNDAHLLKLADAADGMRVLVGFVEEGYGAQYYNSAAMLHDGRLAFVHRKLNLANYGDMQEAKYFAQGRYIEPVPLPGPFTGAVLLCSDMWNPALVHIAALHGATLLLVPTSSSIDRHSGDATKPARWDLVLRFYASIYGLPIVFVNRVGTEGAYKFWGGSRIVDPYGNALAQTSGNAEELLVSTVSYADVRKARFELPTVRDSNLALIHREIDRLAVRIGVPDILGR